MTRLEPSKVTTIDHTQDIVTLINIFTVQPTSQQLFLEAQIGEYKRLSGKIAGSLGANLHRGLSGRKAVNYAQFRTVEQFRAWQASDLMKDHLPLIQPYVEGIQPGIYRVVEVISRDGRAARIEESATSVALIAAFTAEPGAVGELVAAQRATARRLMADLPGLCSLTIHQGIQPTQRPAVASGAQPDGRPEASSGRPLANAALYAQLDSEEAFRALDGHPVYREWFTTDNPRIHASETDLYTAVYVQNEAALQAESRAALR
jgi:hypothetical protein